jgi:DNA repair protein RadC
MAFCSGKNWSRPSDIAIMAHNHPSGNLEPGNADRKITSKIKNSLELMGMALLDHITIKVIGLNSIIEN